MTQLSSIELEEKEDFIVKATVTCVTYRRPTLFPWQMLSLCLIAGQHCFLGNNSPHSASSQANTIPLAAAIQDVYD